MGPRALAALSELAPGSMAVDRTPVTTLELQNENGGQMGLAPGAASLLIIEREEHPRIFY